MANKQAANTHKKATSSSASSQRKPASRARAKSTAKSSAATKRSRESDATTSGARSRTSTDHDETRQWAEDRGAHPACVKGTGNKGDVGMLRLDFPGYSEEKLQAITWDEFFEKFDERELALVFQEKTADGAKSNFNKLVNRDEAEQKPKTRTAR
jgi:hypothetical protein